MIWLEFEKDCGLGLKLLLCYGGMTLVVMVKTITTWLRLGNDCGLFFFYRKRSWFDLSQVNFIAIKTEVILGSSWCQENRQDNAQLSIPIKPIEILTLHIIA